MTASGWTGIGVCSDASRTAGSARLESAPTRSDDLNTAAGRTGKLASADAVAELVIESPLTRAPRDDANPSTGPDTATSKAALRVAGKLRNLGQR